MRARYTRPSDDIQHAWEPEQIVALVQKDTDAVIDPYAERSAMKPHSISDSQL